MSLRINHNIDAIVGQRNLAMNSTNLSHSLQRLSSGLRINSAADDPSGLVISEQMRAQITGLNQAVSNTQNAVSMVQTTEGALDEVNSLLDKARQLTLDAANTGVNDTNQLAADQSELDNVISSISRISSVTQFGTKNLLDGSLNGATSLATGLSHVRVGNLANNSAISVGVVNMAITAGVKEGMVLKRSGGTDSYIFSGAVSGVKMGTKNVLSGVSVALNIGTGAVSYTTASVMNASTLAGHLNTLAASLGFGVTANSNGELVVSRNNIGSADFSAKISFSRAGSAAIAGNKEAITSTLKVTNSSGQTGSGAAALIFSGVTKLSGASSTTVVNGGTTFAYTIKTATGGVYSGNFAVATGTTKTMAQVLSGLQTSIRTKATFSGSTVALGAGVTSGLNVKLARGFDTIATDFQFSLNIDYKNNATTKSQANLITIAGAFQTGANSTFITSAGVSGVTAANITGTTKLASGAAMELTISGQTIVLTGGRSMTALATAFTTAVHALGGNLANVTVAFTTGGAAKYSGLAGQVGITGAIGAKGFVVYDNDGRALNVSLKVDQKQGFDINLAGPQTKAGVRAGATLDLSTVAQARTGNTATIAAVTGHTVASTSGASTVVSGADAKATMTTANAVVLNLTTTFTSATGSSLLTLTSGSKALGYQNFSAEISKALSVGGGSASFTLNNGALFQIGANGLQQVGLTIDATSASDLGRNASATLNSLDDLTSNHKGALTNGMSGEALKVIDAAINQITNLRGSLGAFQSNTLQSGLNSLQVSQQNLTAAESTIRDVDFAAESASFTKNQILVQASTSMLAQANQLPQSVLKLLG